MTSDLGHSKTEGPDLQGTIQYFVQFEASCVLYQHNTYSVLILFLFLKSFCWAFFLGGGLVLRLRFEAVLGQLSLQFTTKN